MKRVFTIKTIKGVLLALSCSVILFSCSKWDDFKDYTKDGEIMYTGKMDSVRIFPGNGRVMFKGTLNADPKIVKYKIFWNDLEDSVEFHIDKGSGRVPVEETFEVDEGVKSFVIYTYDELGNSSVPVNAVGTSYGSAYRRKLSNRLVRELKYEMDRTTLYWDQMDVSIGAQYTELEYSVGGEKVQLTTPVSVDSTILEGVNNTITVRYRTVFKPEQTSIDTFAVPFADYYIPGEPVITSVEPLRGQVGGKVTIVGKNFGEDLKNVKLAVGGVNANIISLSDEKIEFEVPETTSGFIVMEFGLQTYEIGYFNIPKDEDYTHTITHLMFDGGGDDASGNDNAATLAGSATYGTGLIDQGLVLNGSGHATLPTGIISGLNEMTIASYVKLNNIADWTRLWDFGTGTNVYAFLTIQSGHTKAPRFAFKNGGGEQLIESNAGTLNTGQWYHIAVTYKENVGIMYIDGVEVGRNENITIKPSDLGETNQNYIGKAQFPDPLLNGTVDDFRIYNRALSAEEIEEL